MLVRITDLPLKGLKINDHLSLEKLNERVAEGRDTSIAFTIPPVVDLTLFPSHGGATSSGKVTTKYTQECSTCLDPIERELELEAKFIFKPRTSESDADDIGVWYFDGDEINLEEVIQEALILSLQLYWHPPRDAQERCSVCGKRVEFENGQAKKKSGTSLAELLKKAGVSTN